MTIRTFFFYYLAGTVTVRTGLDITHRTEERLLGEYHLALTAAFRTGNRLCTRLCPCSMTGLTFFLYIQLYGLGGAEHRLFKGYMDTGT